MVKKDKYLRQGNNVQRKTILKIFLMVGGVTAGNILYFAYYYYIYAHQIGEEARTSSNFQLLYSKLLEYHDKHHVWPKALEDLDIGRAAIDHFTKRPYLYFPQARYGTTDILVAQPEPYRLGVWPWTKIRRYVMTARMDNTSILLEGEEALLSIPEAQKAIARRLGYKEKDE